MQLLPTTHAQVSIGEKIHDFEAVQPASNSRFEMRKFIVVAGVFVVSLFLVISGQLPSFFISYRSTDLRLYQPSLDILPSQSTPDSLRPDPTEGSKPVFDTRHGSSSKTDAHESGSIGERRRFFPVGSASYLFIEMGAYRGGSRDFYIAGLGAKSVHDFSDGSFTCEWISASGNHSVAGRTAKFIPEHWGFSRIYTAMVVSCGFDEDVGTASEGGELILTASPGASFEKNTARMVALREYPGDYNATLFDPPYPYEYVYCGSPLFGDISPQRVREWVAYHAHFFGPRSHFFLYDAGGIHPDVQTILEPWIDAGRITIQNVLDQEQFDGYYHNQFLVVNDCLHRTRFLANWTFFLDLDEFLYVPENSSLRSVLDEHSGFIQLYFNQEPMSSQLCLKKSKANHSKLWGFEKLAFKYSPNTVPRRDRKYAVQPRNVYAGGVHFSESLNGNTGLLDARKLRYYHYHGSLSARGEVCQIFVDTANSTDVVFEGEVLTADYSMLPLGASIRSFEFEQIGEQPFFV